MSTKVPFAMPQNTRTITIRRRDAVRVFWKLALPSVIKTMLVFVPIYLLNALRLYGIDHLKETSTWWYGAQLMTGLGLVVCACVLMTAIFRLGRIKTLNTPTLCGFDKESLYHVNVYAQNRIRWESFYRWKQMPGFFVLFEGDHKVVLPSRFWTKEELDALRGILEAKVDPSSAIRTLNA